MERYRVDFRLRLTANVLIVEDDPDLRRIYWMALSLAGFLVEAASDGFEALQKLEQRSPDLILLDLGLPILSGQTVLNELAGNALTRNVPVVVVTGQIDIPLLPAATVLHKPVEPPDLVRTVRACLHARRSAASSHWGSRKKVT